MNILNNYKAMEWILRIGVAGEFIGHGALALGGKAQWVGWVKQLSSVSESTALTFLLVVGVIDILLALIVLFRPLPPLLLWMTFWGFFTAILRPIVGESFWDFIERFANWGAPLALYILLKLQKSAQNS